MAHRTIAIVYDFDGTLSPHSMQEYTVLPQIGIKGPKFWDEVRKENRRIQGEIMITYMMKMLDLANEKRVKITQKALRQSAIHIKYFPGVKKFFRRINEYVRKISEGRVKVHHYVISAGLKEILDGISIRNDLERIYASEYNYNHYGAATFPKLVITDTVKTQFLFRINKGKEDLDQSVNEHMPEEERPIPFSNILYLGDGLSDVPSMTVTMKNRGYAIAVYSNREGNRVCRKLFRAARVDFMAKADYRSGSDLDKAIKQVLRIMVESIFFQDASLRNYLKHVKG